MYRYTTRQHIIEFERKRNFLHEHIRSQSVLASVSTSSSTLGFFSNLDVGYLVVISCRRDTTLHNFGPLSTMPIQAKAQHAPWLHLSAELRMVIQLLAFREQIVTDASYRQILLGTWPAVLRNCEAWGGLRV